MSNISLFDYSAIVIKTRTSSTMKVREFNQTILQAKSAASVSDWKVPEGGSEPEMAPSGPRRKSELKIDIEGLPEGKSHVDVLCFDLVYFTRPAQFIILSAGVFFFYLLYGYYQVGSAAPQTNSN